MTPRQFRAGGAKEELRFAVGQCSLGAILVASSAKGVASILIGDDPETLIERASASLAECQVDTLFT